MKVIKTERLHIEAMNPSLWHIKDHLGHLLGQLAFQDGFFSINLIQEAQGLGVASEASLSWLSQHASEAIKAEQAIDPKAVVFLERMGFTTSLDVMVWQNQDRPNLYQQLNRELGIESVNLTAPYCPSACRLIDVGLDVFDRPARMDPQAAVAWQQMQNEASLSGVSLQLVSAYRSPKYQAALIQNKINKGQKLDDILKVNAAPGHSEHHSGRAIDLTTPGFEVLETHFEESPAFAWLQTYGKKHGFTLSYPRGNPHGIIYEPWHWCYHPS